LLSYVFEHVNVLPLPGHGDYTTKAVDCIKATGLTIDEAAAAAAITVKVIVTYKYRQWPQQQKANFYFFILSKF